MIVLGKVKLQFFEGFKTKITCCVVVVEPHCEAVIPVHLIHRQSKAENANQGFRILEPCGNRLQDKGLYIGRTLVSAGDNGLVPVRILNTADKMQTVQMQVTGVSTRHWECLELGTTGQA